MRCGVRGCCVARSRLASLMREMLACLVSTRATLEAPWLELLGRLREIYSINCVPTSASYNESIDRGQDELLLFCALFEIRKARPPPRQEHRLVSAFIYALLLHSPMLALCARTCILTPLHEPNPKHSLDTSTINLRSTALPTGEHLNHF